MHTDTSKLTNEQSTPQIYHGTAIVLSDPKKKKKKKEIDAAEPERSSFFIYEISHSSLKKVLYNI